MVCRPEDVFLRRPENLMQNYRRLTDGVVDEVSFVGAFERVIVRVELPGRNSIVVTRPKTETTAFPLHRGQEVPIGVVRFRILGESLKAASRAV
jgi:hypothetical protein